MSADIDVVIVNWNGGDLLRSCLMSLATVEGAAGVQVIVVDNASTDTSLERLPALPRPLRSIRNGENHGFGRACNAGAAAGTAPAILFLNPGHPGRFAMPSVSRSPHCCQIRKPVSSARA